jgi:hypothetical protein
LDTPLLVVDGSFAARGRGALLSPRITVKDPPRAPFTVRLHLPDGSDRVVTAVFEVAHIRGPDGVFAMVRLPDLAPGDVPPGTEVWATVAGA